MSCETISVRKVDYYVNNPFARMIDIRDQKDYEKSHIKNAINIPYDDMICFLRQIQSGNRRVNDYENKNQQYYNIMIDKSKIYVIYCDRGAMSMVVCNKLSQLGYVTKTVVGGFLKYNGKYIV